MRQDGTQTFGFLLLPGFALMSYAAAVEPLRAANVLSGRQLYRWLNLSVDGKAVPASNGAAIAADAAIAGAIHLDTIIVCAGGNPALQNDPAVLRWLSRQARLGRRIGGVSGGPYILARAGLLDGFRATVHWEHHAVLAEAFPDVRLQRTLYEIDRNRLTCAGGVAALDMMRALIAAEHGRALADKVSDWFVSGQLREGQGAQRLSAADRYGVTHPGLIRALAAVDTDPARARTAQELAALAGVSPRHLARLARSAFGMPIGEYVVQARLDLARTLLRQSAMSIAQVAAASGFESPSHLARRYRARFGRSPRADRQAGG